MDWFDELRPAFGWQCRCGAASTYDMTHDEAELALFAHRCPDGIDHPAIISGWETGRRPEPESH